MASYQDLEVRVKTIEDKLDFVLNAIRIGQPSKIIGAPPIVMSLFDLYIESKRAGLTIEPATPAPEIING